MHIVCFHLYAMSRIDTSIKMERSVVTRGWAMTATGNGVSFWGDENVLELDTGDGCMILCLSQKSPKGVLQRGELYGM